MLRDKGGSKSLFSSNSDMMKVVLLLAEHPMLFLPSQLEGAISRGKRMEGTNRFVVQQRPLLSQAQPVA